MTVDVVVAPEVADAFLRIAALQLVSGAEPVEVGRDGRGTCWRLVVTVPRSARARALGWAPDVVVVEPADVVDELRVGAAAAALAYPRLK